MGVDEPARCPGGRIPSHAEGQAFHRPDLCFLSWSPHGGIEPPRPSLPWNHREPLCATPFSQVARDRRCRSQRFSFGDVMRSLHASELSSLGQHLDA
jgi:hypothetical protein